MLVNTYKFPDLKDKINEFLAKANNQLIYYSIEYNEFLFRALSNRDCYCICISHENKITGLLWFHIYENDTGVKNNTLPFLVVTVVQ